MVPSRTATTAAAAFGESTRPRLMLAAFPLLAQGVENCRKRGLCHLDSYISPVQGLSLANVSLNESRNIDGQFKLYIS